MPDRVDKVYSPVFFSPGYQPFSEGMVSAGFPSPAADYEEGELDLNEYMVNRPAATYFVRAVGDSMIGAGIHSGDLLVVDRSIQPRDKNVVIAAVDGELTVKRIRMKNGRVTLEAENDNYSSQEIDREREFEVWGVVTAVIHKL